MTLAQHLADEASGILASALEALGSALRDAPARNGHLDEAMILVANTSYLAVRVEG